MAAQTQVPPVGRSLPPTADLPPGPTAGRFAQCVAFHRDPLRFLQLNQERFGDVFTVNIALAGRMVVVADPQRIDRVVQADPGAGHAGEGRRHILGMVSPQSVLGADGAQHEDARGSVAGAFRPEALEGLGQPMAEIAERHAAAWPRGRPFRVLPRMRRLQAELFARLMLGVRDDTRARALADATWRMLWTPGNPPFPPPGQGDGLAGVAGLSLFERRKEPVARLLAAEIDDRRRSQAERHDAIGCMLRARPNLSTADAVDRLIPLMMAGQEPPSAGLTWVLDRVAREPGVADRFVSPAGDDAYRRAFIRETLRLTPAVHSVVRWLVRPLDLGDRTLPAGVAATVPMVLVHRHPEAFPEPDVFRPERFMPDPDADGRDLPFGGGRRRCLGMWLAHAEFGSVLPAILRQVRLRPLWPQPERMVVRGTVLVQHRSELAVAV